MPSAKFLQKVQKLFFYFKKNGGNNIPNDICQSIELLDEENILEWFIQLKYKNNNNNEKNKKEDDFFFVSLRIVFLESYEDLKPQNENEKEKINTILENNNNNNNTVSSSDESEEDEKDIEIENNNNNNHNNNIDDDSNPFGFEKDNFFLKAQQSFSSGKTIEESSSSSDETENNNNNENHNVNVNNENVNHNNNTTLDEIKSKKEKNPEINKNENNQNNKMLVPMPLCFIIQPRLVSSFIHSGSLCSLDLLAQYWDLSPPHFILFLSSLHETLNLKKQEGKITIQNHNNNNNNFYSEKEHQLGVEHITRAHVHLFRKKRNINQNNENKILEIEIKNNNNEKEENKKWCTVNDPTKIENILFSEQNIIFKNSELSKIENNKNCIFSSLNGEPQMLYSILFPNNHNNIFEIKGDENFSISNYYQNNNNNNNFCAFTLHNDNNNNNNNIIIPKDKKITISNLIIYNHFSVLGEINFHNCIIIGTIHGEENANINFQNCEIIIFGNDTLYKKNENENENNNNNKSEGILLLDECILNIQYCFVHCIKYDSFRDVYVSPFYKNKNHKNKKIQQNNNHNNNLSSLIFASNHSLLQISHSRINPNYNNNNNKNENNIINYYNAIERTIFCESHNSFHLLNCILFSGNKSGIHLQGSHAFLECLLLLGHQNNNNENKNNNNNEMISGITAELGATVVGRSLFLHNVYFSINIIANSTGHFYNCHCGEFSEYFKNQKFKNFNNNSYTVDNSVMSLTDCSSCTEHVSVFVRQQAKCIIHNNNNNNNKNENNCNYQNEKNNDFGVGEAMFAVRQFFSELTENNKNNHNFSKDEKIEQFIISIKDALLYTATDPTFVQRLIKDSIYLFQNNNNNNNNENYEKEAVEKYLAAFYYIEQLGMERSKNNNFNYNNNNHNNHNLKYNGWPLQIEAEHPVLFHKLIPDDDADLLFYKNENKNKNRNSENNNNNSNFIPPLLLMGGRYGIEINNATVDINSILILNTLETAIYGYGNENRIQIKNGFSWNFIHPIIFEKILKWNNNYNENEKLMQVKQNNSGVKIFDYEELYMCNLIMLDHVYGFAVVSLQQNHYNENNEIENFQNNKYFTLAHCCAIGGKNGFTFHQCRGHLYNCGADTSHTGLSIHQHCSIAISDNNTVVHRRKENENNNHNENKNQNFVFCLEQAYNGAEYGIEVGHTSRAQVKNCIILGGKECGIGIHHSCDVYMEDCFIDLTPGDVFSYLFKKQYRPPTALSRLLMEPTFFQNKNNNNDNENKKEEGSNSGGVKLWCGSRLHCTRVELRGASFGFLLLGANNSLNADRCVLKHIAAGVTCEESVFILSRCSFHCSHHCLWLKPHAQGTLLGGGYHSKKNGFVIEEHAVLYLESGEENNKKKKKKVKIKQFEQTGVWIMKKGHVIGDEHCLLEIQTKNNNNNNSQNNNINKQCVLVESEGVLNIGNLYCDGGDTAIAGESFSKIIIHHFLGLQQFGRCGIFLKSEAVMKVASHILIFQNNNHNNNETEENYLINVEKKAVCHLIAHHKNHNETIREIFEDFDLFIDHHHNNASFLDGNGFQINGILQVENMQLFFHNNNNKSDIEVFDHASFIGNGVIFHFHSNKAISIHHHSQINLQHCTIKNYYNNNNDTEMCILDASVATLKKCLFHPTNENNNNNNNFSVKISQSELNSYNCIFGNPYGNNNIHHHFYFDRFSLIRFAFCYFYPNHNNNNNVMQLKHHSRMEVHSVNFFANRTNKIIKVTENSEVILQNTHLLEHSNDHCYFDVSADSKIIAKMDKNHKIFIFNDFLCRLFKLRRKNEWWSIEAHKPQKMTLNLLKWFHLATNIVISSEKIFYKY